MNRPSSTAGEVAEVGLQGSGRTPGSAAPQARGALTPEKRGATVKWAPRVGASILKSSDRRMARGSAGNVIIPGVVRQPSADLPRGTDRSV